MAERLATIADKLRREGAAEDEVVIWAEAARRSYSENIERSVGRLREEDQTSRSPPTPDGSAT